MVKNRNSFFLLFLLPLFCNAQISSVVEGWKADKDLKSATLSFCVIDTKTGEIVAELNSHQYVIPASTQKVITTAAALGTLGAGYRNSTKIYHTGTFSKESGVIKEMLLFMAPAILPYNLKILPVKAPSSQSPLTACDLRNNYSFLASHFKSNISSTRVGSAQNITIQPLFDSKTCLLMP